MSHITRTDRCQGEAELALSRQRAGWHLRRESTWQRYSRGVGGESMDVMEEKFWVTRTWEACDCCHKVVPKTKHESHRHRLWVQEYRKHWHCNDTSQKPFRETRGSLQSIRSTSGEAEIRTVEGKCHTKVLCSLPGAWGRRQRYLPTTLQSFWTPNFQPSFSQCWPNELGQSHKSPRVSCTEDRLCCVVLLCWEGVRVMNRMLVHPR